MPTFTPPTYQKDSLREVGSTMRQGLMRHYTINSSYSVLITGGVASPYPGREVPSTDDINSADPGSGIGGRAAFLGGRTYEVTSGEASILQAAGYSTT